MAEVLLPISSIISMARLLREPAVSTAIDANICVAVKLEYFIILLAAALFATSPACDDVSCICESTNVFTMVTFQANSFPLDHGIRVVLSGPLPSLHMSPTRSLLDGVCVRNIVR